jgi:hypothetical protein
LIHEAKLKLLDKFQENVESLNNEGFSEVEAKRQSFSELLPKLTKQLEDIYVERLLWMSHMKKDPIHKKIMQTRDNLIDADLLDREEAFYSALEKRKFLFKCLLEKEQHYSDDESDINEKNYCISIFSKSQFHQSYLFVFIFVIVLITLNRIVFS